MARASSCSVETYVDLACSYDRVGTTRKNREDARKEVKSLSFGAVHTDVFEVDCYIELDGGGGINKVGSRLRNAICPRLVAVCNLWMVGLGDSQLRVPSVRPFMLA